MTATTAALTTLAARIADIQPSTARRELDSLARQAGLTVPPLASNGLVRKLLQQWAAKPQAPAAKPDPDLETVRCPTCQDLYQRQEVGNGSCCACLESGKGRPHVEPKPQTPQAETVQRTEQRGDGRLLLYVKAGDVFRPATPAEKCDGLWGGRDAKALALGLVAACDLNPDRVLAAVDAAMQARLLEQREAVKPEPKPQASKPAPAPVPAAAAATAAPTSKPVAAAKPAEPKAEPKPAAPAGLTPAVQTAVAALALTAGTDATDTALRAACVTAGLFPAADVVPGTEGGVRGRLQQWLAGQGVNWATAVQAAKTPGPKAEPKPQGGGLDGFRRLQQLCKQHGLAADGKREQLVERLVAKGVDPNATPAPAPKAERKTTDRTGETSEPLAGLFVQRRGGVFETATLADVVAKLAALGLAVVDAQQLAKRAA
jgi:hypothetical protein